MKDASAPVRRAHPSRRTLGIVGAGQLARMTIEAAAPLGVPVVLLAESPTDAATELATRVLLGAPDDAGQLWALAARCDVMTFDHEHVDLEMLATFEEAGVAVRPGAGAMRLGVDKAHMRTTLAAGGIPVPPYGLLDPKEPLAAQVQAFARTHGWPVVLKTARGGYDGKGVWPVANAAEAEAVCERASSARLSLLVEQHVPIDFELAALVVRGRQGIRAWPVVETTQFEGVCREVLFPGRVSPAMAGRAQAIAMQVADAIDLIGVMAVEMFSVGGHLLVNEVALRPHNSGHWTIEGAETSQFENHIRAVLDLPLGDPAPRAPAVAMVNVLGPRDGSDPALHLDKALAVAGAHVHLYGKDPRPGRKLGHVTVAGADAADVRTRAWQAAAELGSPLPERSLPSIGAR